MNLKRPFKRVIATIVLSALAWTAHGKQAHAGQPYVVSESSAGRIWRIEDANNDGDALDVGERTRWGDGFTGARGMAADGRAVYVTEEGLADGSNQVVRLFDANRDGDALDIGERTIWLDGLDDPRDMSFDGFAYLSEFDNNQVWRLTDSNYDGDVHDVGEKTLFAEGISGPQMIVPNAGTLLVAAFNGDQVHRLTDRNGDGDALDVAENLVITPSYDQHFGLLNDGAGGFYFSSVSTDTVYHAHDRNGDGDLLDVAEVLSYADFVYGLINGPAGLTAIDGGGFLASDSFNNQVKRVRDKNGDGDALDLGDVALFADGISQPIDVVALPFFRPGDYNFNGVVDAADYVVWRKTLGQTGFALAADGNVNNQVDAGDFEVWRAHFGESAGSGAAQGLSASVPEPCTLLLILTAANLYMPIRSSRRLRV